MKKVNRNAALIRTRLFATAIFIVSLAAIPGIVNAQETLGFGVSAGRSCGNGFSVRRLPVNGFGWQAGGIYLKSSTTTYSNIGVEQLYILNRTENSSLYLVGGLSYSYERTRSENWVWDSQTASYYTQVGHSTSKGLGGGVGVGAAFRYAQWDQIWFSADLMLTAYHDTVLPSPQCAIHYFFR